MAARLVYMGLMYKLWLPDWGCLRLMNILWLPVGVYGVNDYIVAARLV